MKLIRYMIMLTIIGITIISCDDRNKMIQLLDTKPTIYFTVKDKNIGSLTDSIRLYSNENYYTVNLNVNDKEENIWKLYYKVVQGSAEVFYNKQKLELSSIRSDLKKIPVDVNALSPGLNIIEITAEDKFMNTATVTLNLFAFSNLKPLAILTATKIGVNSPLEYKLDATKSSDQDQSFGGRVVGYIYEVEGNIITTTNPTLNYIFKSPGIYTSHLKVIDNNGEMSDSVELKITVN